jgi:hypothetical protein
MKEKEQGERGGPGNGSVSELSLGSSISCRNSSSLDQDFPDCLSGYSSSPSCSIGLNLYPAP